MERAGRKENPYSYGLVGRFVVKPLAQTASLSNGITLALQRTISKSLSSSSVGKHYH